MGKYVPREVQELGDKAVGCVLLIVLAGFIVVAFVLIAAKPDPATPRTGSDQPPNGRVLIESDG